MVANTVPLMHVAYTALAAMAVMIASSFVIGRSFLKNTLSFCIGFAFLLVLYALGVQAAPWAMILIAGMVVLGLISSALG